jgi:hypothetical protein
MCEYLKVLILCLMNRCDFLKFETLGTVTVEVFHFN